MTAGPGQEPDRKLAEDDSLPVQVEADVDYSTPEGWDWRDIGASQSSRATFHINHSDVNQVVVDVLRPTDSPPDAPFVLTRNIPIIIMDSLDKCWAGESRKHFPLNGLRVPVEGDTIEEAKQKLAADLSAQFRLLMLLFTSHQGKIAPPLQENLRLLQEYLAPNPRSSGS